MNILKKITYKNILLNKKRNIVTLIGIILSVALITAVSSLVVSFKDSIINLEKQLNGDFHYSFSNVESQDLNKFYSNRKIENIYKLGSIGYAKIDSRNEYKPYAYVISMDKNSMEGLGIKLISGNLPLTSNEVVIPRHLKNNGGLSISIGSYITLNVGTRVSEGYTLNQSNPFDIETSEDIVSAKEYTFKVVGIYERPSSLIEPFSAPGYTFITSGVEVPNYTVYARYNKEGLKNHYEVTAGILGIDKTIFEEGMKGNSEYTDKYESELSKAKYSFNNNRYLLMLETNTFRESSMKALLAVSSVVIFIIIVTSVYCIKNSFNISITERIKEFGILKSVGATSKQIKKSVYYESFILSIIGIPIGIACGILASYILIYLVDYLIKESFVDDGRLIFSISILSIIISVILSLVTIFLSSAKASRIASKTSPMVLIRGNNVIKVNKNKLKCPKFIKSIFGIGGVISYKNIKRNKKKYKTTVVSIVLSVSVFIALSYFVNTAFDVVKKENGEFNHNFTFSSYLPDYKDNYNNILEISKHPSIEEYSIVSTGVFKGEVDLNSDINKYYNNMYSGIDSITYINVISVGKSEYLRYINKLKLDYDVVKDKGILIDNDMGYSNEKKVNVSYRLTNNKAGDIITLTGDKGEVFDIELASVTSKRPLGYESYYGTILIVVSDEYMDKLSKREVVTINALSNDTDKLQSYVESMYKDIDDEYYYLNNVDANLRQMKSIYLVIAIFLYGFIIVISLIGITNIFNTITTNMALRKREFATLKSIGMTNKEFNKMIFLESFFYIFKSLIIGIPIGIILSYLIYLGLTNEMIFIYFLPIEGIIVSTILVCLLIVLLNKYSSSKANKGNIIDTIRSENI